VADNGVGLPEGFDAGETESLGMLLVNALTDQLDGRLEWNAGKGTVWKMTFPVRPGTTFDCADSSPG
jgi:two-component sensor histidine kinase